MCRRAAIDERLGLSGAEVEMRLVLRDRLVRIEGFVHVDQEMMMTAVRRVAARLGDAHVAKAEPAPERSFHGCAVGRPNDVEEGVGGRAGLLGVRGDRRQRGQQGGGQVDRMSVINRVSFYKE